jgi:uncharacterized protein (DUF433 family)/DNA-binding transcriptional MerR regulator
VPVAVADETLVALTQERAAELAGVSPHQLRYWASTDLVRPTVDTRLTPQRPIRLYGYVELMALLITAELRRRKVPLQAVRGVVEYGRSKGFAQPLTELVFATVGREVYIRLPDGTWSSGKRPDEIVIHQVIELEPLRARIRSSAVRPDGALGRFERRRGVMGGKELVTGTRVPVETVRRYLRRGASVAEVVEAFPVLAPADVEAVQRTLTVA